MKEAGAADTPGQPDKADKPGKTAALAYDQSAGAGDEAARDVFAQLDAAEAALGELGWRVRRVAVGLDLGKAKRDLAAPETDLVVNLVESLAGSDRLQTVFVMAMEEWGVPFTGSGSTAMFLSNDKLLTKRLLDRRGLPVADCVFPVPGGGPGFFPASAGGAHPRPGTWIVKPLAAHASLGMTDDSVFEAGDAEEILGRIRAESGRRGLDCFSERYIEGREFNLSLLGEPGGGARVLPPAEIEFVDFPAGKPRIVGYAAKWDEASGEYGKTARSFAAADREPRLAEALRRTATDAWAALGLSGYARVDFRVDREGKPWILEINANPCLSPDAGFAAAAERAGWSFADMLGRIVDEALGRRRHDFSHAIS
ncbi:MAG: D-alanine--D-alanine ligase [Planctomycetota bacterium]|jgi:D-alanine-D-alanine ligase|nr:D-alanine--D-alanine ligase [Planctomycetota bacterium]